MPLYRTSVQCVKRSQGFIFSSVGAGNYPLPVAVDMRNCRMYCCEPMPSKHRLNLCLTDPDTIEFVKQEQQKLRKQLRIHLSVAQTACKIINDWAHEKQQQQQQDISPKSWPFPQN